MQPQRKINPKRVKYSEIKELKSTIHPRVLKTILKRFKRRKQERQARHQTRLFRSLKR